MGAGLVRKPAQAVVFPTSKPAPTPAAQTVRQAVLPPVQNSYTVPVPNAIPSTALSAGVTKTDVQAKRDAMQKTQDAKLTSAQTFQQGLAGIQANPQSTDFISSLMFPQVTPTTQARDTLVTEQQGLLSKARDFITGRNRDSAGELTKMQEEAGLPQLQERISVSNERIAQLKGELMKVRPQIEGEAGQTRIGAEARLSPVERNLNAEIASEALVQSALVGNANMVQNNIDKIMDLEFKDEQAQLNDMMLGIQMVGQEIQTLDPKLQEEATQRLQQFQFAVQERASALQTAQQNKAGVLQVLSQAAQNGAPQQVLDAIKSAQTPEQAMSVTSGYMTDLLDRQYKQAQIAGIGIENQKKLQEINQGLMGSGVAFTENGQQVAASEPPKQPTVSEQGSLIFFSRMKEAVDNLDAVEGEIRGLWLFGQAQLNYLPSFLQSNEQQLYTQAAQQFTEARLRKDSGAAIPPQEFANDRRMYFPQPGDNADVLDQKRQARSTALSAIRQASGNAYWQLYGEPPTVVTRREQAEQAEYAELIKNATPEQLAAINNQ
jgi:hypothetical protein